MIRSLRIAGCAGALAFVALSAVPVFATATPLDASRVSRSSGLAADWPQLGFDSARTGASTSETALKPAVVRTLGQAWRSFSGIPFGASPVIVDGVLYIGDETAQGNFRAIDTTNGQALWTQPLGAAVVSTAAVDGDLIYVGSRNADGADSFFALNASDGSVAWSRALGVIDSSPTVVGGKVFVGSGDHHLYALDATTGTTAWSQVSTNVITSSPAVSNGAVYVGSWDDEVLAFSAATGTPVAGGFATKFPVVYAPVVSGGMVYAVDGKFLYAADAATGQIRWQLRHPKIAAEPAVSGGTVYLALYSPSTSRASLLAVDAASGDVQWSRAIAQATPSPPSIADGVVYAGAVEAIRESTSRIIWSAPIDASSPVAIAEGRIYVAGDGIYAFSPNGA